MQYETIILELLSRIKNLENEVDSLKLALSERTPNPERLENNSPEKTAGHVQPEESGPYKKMTAEMIDICYQYGKKIGEGENVQMFANEIVRKTGMNRNSAIMYIYAVSSMLQGTIYKRAISAKAIEKYFDKIYQEYGDNGLQKAIQATKLHINYRKRFGHTVDSIEKICEKYEMK